MFVFYFKFYHDTLSFLLFNSMNSCAHCSAIIEANEFSGLCPGLIIVNHLSMGEFFIMNCGSSIDLLAILAMDPMRQEHSPEYTDPSIFPSLMYWMRSGIS